jgi:hypothetical protein
VDQPNPFKRDSKLVEQFLTPFQFGWHAVRLYETQGISHFIEQPISLGSVTVYNFRPKFFKG